MPVQARPGNRLHKVTYIDTSGEKPREVTATFNRETVYGRAETIAEAIGDSVIVSTVPPELQGQIEAVRAEAQPIPVA